MPAINQKKSANELLREQRDGILLVVLGCLIFVLLGIIGERAFPAPFSDFRGMYFPARCLLEGHNPYDSNEVLKTYQSDRGLDLLRDRPDEVEVATRYMYPPSSFAATMPFAVLPRKLAQVLWMSFTACALMLAALLTQACCRVSSPLLAGLWAGFILANGQLVMIAGNPGGLVAGILVLAALSFANKRFEIAGTVCLALALCLKPQNAEMVWLYFFAAGSMYRRRSLQTLAVFLILATPFFVWATHISPSWMHEMLSNISAHGVRGGVNDPGPTGKAHGLLMWVSLQAVFSMIRDDPHFYNLASYLVSGLIFAVWLVKTWRAPITHRTTWLSLAVAANLTMLPVYHRQYDTALLLLTIPASALLWVEGGVSARVTVVLSAAAIMFNGNLTWVVILAVLHRLEPVSGGWVSQLFGWLQAAPAPLSLLASSIAFLWLYVRSGNEQQGDAVQASASAQA